MKSVFLLVLLMPLCQCPAYPQDRLPTAPRPKGGYVPDEATAVVIAEAILKPIYGAASVVGERPFRGHLKGDLWTVEGTLHAEMGGVAIVKIRRSDGCIVFVTHEK